MVRGWWAAVSYHSIKSNNSLGSLKKVAREHRTQLTAKERNIDFVKVNSMYKMEKLSQIVQRLGQTSTNLLPN